MVNLYKHLKVIDFYAKPFNLPINGEYKHKTVFGGIASIITIVMLIVIF